ncbi:MAG: DivIVA domain-containing protein [Actinobacteria bacterium]|nr:DivIVA domain-containing protein [Actinomycetota bacterium]
MELTPKVLRDVQFREKLRGGYHPEDVDAFLEQAALAAEELQERLQRAETRAERAERSLEDASTNDDTLKRVLLMAQRTADQTVREAREEAERLLGEARAQGQAIVGDAEERGRRAYEAKAAEARADLERTEDLLRRAAREADDLRAWVEVNKAQLLGALREATAAVERAELVGERPVVEVALPPVPAPLGAPGGPGAPASAPVVQPVGERAAGPVPEPLSLAEAPLAEAPLVEAPLAEAPLAEAPLVEAAVAEATVDVRAGAVASEPAGEARDQALGRPGVRGERLVEDAPGAANSTDGDETQPATVAFDERALDNFFQDQDMSAERGLGRFRRRG